MDILQMPSRDAAPDTSLRKKEAALADYLVLVRRFMRLVVVAAILGGTAAAAVSLVGPRTYESTVVFAVSQSKLGESNAVQVQLSTASFRPYVDSRSSALAVIREFGLDKPPNELTATTFLERVASIEEVRGTNLIRVTIRLPDRELGAKVANRLAERAGEMARSVNTAEAVQARDLIKEQVDQAKKRFDDADMRLRQYRETAQIEALKKDVEALLGQRAGVLPLLVNIEAERARLARYDQELAKRERVDTMKKSIDSEPALVEASRASTPDGAAVMGLQMQSESVNTVYAAIDSSAAVSRATLAALEKQRAELLGARKIDAGQLPQLSALYEREAQLARLQVERDLTERIYVDLSSRYEQARLQVAGRGAQLQIIDPAVVADQPVSRHVVRNTTLGAAAAACFALGWILLFHPAVRESVAVR